MFKIKKSTEGLSKRTEPGLAQQCDAGGHYNTLFFNTCAALVSCHEASRHVDKSSGDDGASVHYMTVVPSGGSPNKLSLASSQPPLGTYLFQLKC